MEHRVFLMSVQSCRIRPLSTFKRGCSCTQFVSDRGQLMQLCRFVERQWLNKSSIGTARRQFDALNNAVESFHAALRRRVKLAHPNLYTFLGHLQRASADGETDIARLNRGMSICRSKKRINFINEVRIKACISRFDSGA